MHAGNPASWLSHWCNVMFMSILFCIVASLPCPKEYHCDSNALCVVDPKYPKNPYCRCHLDFKKSNDGTCVGMMSIFIKWTRLKATRSAEKTWALIFVPSSFNFYQYLDRYQQSWRLLRSRFDATLGSKVSLRMTQFFKSTTVIRNWLWSFIVYSFYLLFRNEWVWEDRQPVFWPTRM